MCLGGWFHAFYFPYTNTDFSLKFRRSLPPSKYCRSPWRDELHFIRVGRHSRWAKTWPKPAAWSRESFPARQFAQSVRSSSRRLFASNRRRESRAETRRSGYGWCKQQQQNDTPFSVFRTHDERAANSQTVRQQTWRCSMRSCIIHVSVTYLLGLVSKEGAELNKVRSDCGGSGEPKQDRGQSLGGKWDGIWECLHLLALRLVAIDTRWVGQLGVDN